MKKFRVISDLHLDVNYRCPLKLNDDIFTVICGDTSGFVDESIRWIKENVKYGVGVSGNHLPYEVHSDLTMDELRMKLSHAFPVDDSFTYLDCETDVFYKEVDGILFIGTCMYTDMSITHPKWNVSGNKDLNMQCSSMHMNDYHFGIISRKNTAESFVRMSPFHYAQWFANGYSKIEAILNRNEQLAVPKDVVLITHHPLLSVFLHHSDYIKRPQSMWQFNDASYASDMEGWLLRHPSIKCYCCGHVHAVEEGFHHFHLKHQDGSPLLVVNNSRGYVHYGHDKHFSLAFFVDVSTWTADFQA